MGVERVDQLIEREVRGAGRETKKRVAYTFPSRRALRAVMHRIKTLTNRVARDPLAAQEVPAADLETDQATVLGHHWSSREGTRLAWPAEVAVTRYRYRGHRIPSPWTATEPTRAATRSETIVA